MLGSDWSPYPCGRNPGQVADDAEERRFGQTGGLAPVNGFRAFREAVPQCLVSFLVVAAQRLPLGLLRDADSVEDEPTETVSPDREALAVR